MTVNSLRKRNQALSDCYFTASERAIVHELLAEEDKSYGFPDYWKHNDNYHWRKGY